jgi:hypothetical protein
MDTFEKITIGQPDPQKVKSIINSYEELTTFASGMKSILDEILNDPEKSTLNLLHTILNSSDAKKALLQKYVELNGISVPGLDIDSLISANLININTSLVKEFIEEKDRFDKTRKIIEENRYLVPLSRFYEPDNNCFGLPQSFEADVILNLSVYTESEKENEVVLLLQELADVFNKLIAFGLVPKDQRCFDVKNFILPALKFEVGLENPVLLSQQIFRNPKINQFSKNRSKFLRTPDNSKGVKLIS